MTTNEANITMDIVPLPQNLSIIVLPAKRAFAMEKLRLFGGIIDPDRPVARKRNASPVQMAVRCVIGW